MKLERRARSLSDWAASLAADPAVPAPRGLTGETWRFSLERTFEGWREELESWSRGGRGPVPREEPVNALAVLPANSPAPLLNTLAAAWLRNVILYAKPARGDEDFTERVLASARAGLPGFDATLALDAHRLDYDRLIVYGRDETVELLRARFGRDRDLFGFGHRFSIACVLDDLDGAAGAAARDIVAWNQDGCLSPQTVFVAAGSEVAFARALAARLEEAERRWPRGPIDPARSLAIHAARAEARMRSGGRAWGSEGGTAWTVLYDERPGLDFTPLARTAWVRTWSPAADFESILAPHAGHCECIGVWPSGAKGHLPPALTEMAVLLGRMQSPPLSRSHGGLPALAFAL